ncbi:MAG: PGPGW domain-containing protein [Acidobacteria bacterium]|nr:PGPGW domain-containing protein [Acidobacteriota bacterium]
MRKTISRIFILVLGWALIILGVIGLFVPILQGILFILLGLWVLSRESQWAQRWLHKMRLRFPATDRRMREVQRKFRRFRRDRKRPPGDEQNDD